MNNSADPYADLRRCVDQLARLLAAQPAGLSQEEEDRLDALLDRLSDVRKKQPMVQKALDTIQNRGQEGRQNRHRIGAELMRIAGALGATAGAADSTAGVADDTRAVVEDAERLAEILVPALLV